MLMRVGAVHASNQEPSTAGIMQVARLAMLSAAAVFADVLPGYRIRLPTDKELAMPVSKEVKRLRDHETGLLRAYQVMRMQYPVTF